MKTVVLKHFHLFCGLGGGAKGFNAARPEVGNLQAKFECLGGIDIDAASIKDFTQLAGVPGTVLDLFDDEQYRAFHGHPPPADWRAATPQDIQAAAQHQRPNIVFLSAPCKGFSGLLAEGKSKSDKYQALNRLTLRGIWLMLEAWSNDPPDLILFENVPRIQSRGRHLLDQIGDLLRGYGYAVAETCHDCGEIGGLAQSRKRFLLVARHTEKVPNFLYQPKSKPLRAVGQVLDQMRLPGDTAAGPMHRIPALAWKTWVRLAFVQAGKDWRSLNSLEVENGYLKDYLVVPEHRNGFMGVQAWDQTSGAVAGRSMPTNGAFSVADPRAPVGSDQYQQYGVVPWQKSMGTVIGVKSPGQGTFSVADPRHTGTAKHSNEFRIVAWDRNAQAVTSSHGSGQAVADPRNAGHNFAKYAVTDYNASSGTVISGSTTGQGAFAVADPRSGMQRSRGDNYLTAGHYGVANWKEHTGAISASASHDNGKWSVADPRDMPAAMDKLVCRIKSLDGTWHRPFTTLELAALQSLFDPAEQFELDGLSDQAWRERIGNAVPSSAAQAIAEVMGTTLLLAMTGETFTLSAQPIWVQPMALAVAMSDIV